VLFFDLPALDFRRKFGRRVEEEDDDDDEKEDDDGDDDGGEDALSFPVAEEASGGLSAPFPPTGESGSGGWSADDDPPERKRFSNPLIPLLPSPLLCGSFLPRGRETKARHVVRTKTAGVAKVGEKNGNAGPDGRRDEKTETERFDG